MYAINRQHAHNILFYLAVAAVAFTLKSHYSRAGADDLFWILAPTAFLVEIVSGIEFTPESGAGYFSPGHRYLIAPACAGVNFLIVAFCMTAFAGVHRLNSPPVLTHELKNGRLWSSPYLPTVGFSRFLFWQAFFHALHHDSN
jgi:hypothetical protein